MTYLRDALTTLVIYFIYVICWYGINEVNYMCFVTFFFLLEAISSFTVFATIEYIFIFRELLVLGSA